MQMPRNTFACKFQGTGAALALGAAIAQWLSFCLSIGRL